ncbi:FAD-dependent oxidoreductase [Fructobacillus sp. M2-14]|uniref:FAD-dependent oxidoreductase n=1 Tax=Fructobacillus broussonetiae TaxID=2713173 RepID=A0ABS5R3A5_9LACO|nr:FAD-dependent oxidoreductase [Fructobacillus broussonetiae]MBS9338637.1 FAD-dependent oxidoreductase [Fructobacillus broussonetiae]
MLKTIKFLKKESLGFDTYTFYFEKPEQLTYTAGQFALFIQGGLTRPHPFSISSAPSEKYLAFTTSIKSQSRFKKRLMNLTKGNKILFIGPIGTMNIDYQKKNLFIAQGIGITPFHAILEEQNNKGSFSENSLIHVAKGDHPFKNVTGKLASKASYPESKEQFETDLLDQLDNDVFFISGSSSFVSDTKQTLLENGIQEDQIKTDVLFGYRY